jgi:DNA topoisomerase-1
VFDIGINRAVALLAEKKAGGGRSRFQRAAPTVLKDLGEHPSEGGKVQVLSGRYGPYVKHGDVNATLPRNKEPAALTMDEAVRLIAERLAKGPSKPKARGGKAARKPVTSPEEGNGKAAEAGGKASAKPATKAAAKARAKPQGKAKGKGKAAGTREAAE